MVKKIMTKNQINIYNQPKIEMNIILTDIISKEKFRMKASFHKHRKISQILICRS